VRGEGLRFIEAVSWAIICTFLECGVEERSRAGVDGSITISVSGDLCGVEPRVHIFFKYTTSKDISAERQCNEGISFTPRDAVVIRSLTCSVYPCGCGWHDLLGNHNGTSISWLTMRFLNWLHMDTLLVYLPLAILRDELPHVSLKLAHVLFGPSLAKQKQKKKRNSRQERSSQHL